MTQSQLERLVARKTGDELDTIRRLGFGLAELSPEEFDPEAPPALPQVVDWDDLDQCWGRSLTR